MSGLIDVVHALTSDPDARTAFAADRAGFLASRFPALSEAARAALLGTDLAALTDAVTRELVGSLSGQFPVKMLYPGLQAQWLGTSPAEGPARTPLVVTIRLLVGPDEIENAEAVFRALRNAEGEQGLWFRCGTRSVRGMPLGYDLDPITARFTLHASVLLDQPGSWTPALNDGAGELVAPQDFVVFDWVRRT